jgi:hypothetical protein
MNKIPTKDLEHLREQCRKTCPNTGPNRYCHERCMATEQYLLRHIAKQEA